jgi:predicted AAA+ superfamily ATPase
LKGNYEPSSFKLYFFDSGLFISMLDDEAQQDLRENRNFGIYKGALYENIAAEILVKQGYSLYYWKKADSTLETDFFIRTAKWLVPVEVKAKKGKSRSMDELIENEKYDEICFGLKISAQNIGFSKQVFTIPYFCAFLLKDFLKNPPVFLEGGQNETDEQ